MNPTHHHQRLSTRLRVALAGVLAPSVRSTCATPTRRRLRVALAGVLALALLAASAVGAQGETSGGPGAGGGGSAGAAETSTASSTTTTTIVPAPEAEAPVGVHGQVGEPSGTETAPAAAGGTAGATGTTPASTAPEVRTQSPQAENAPSGTGGSAKRQPAAHRKTSANGATGKGKSSAGQPSGAPAPPPSTLTPPLPGALGAGISGIPDFFIESFRIPPFLLPIYQAAGTAYDIPWQVLAAINEVETDYGRDLSVSSAGAEGWMQFLPSSWAQYGVDANGAGYADPYNPADAIFAAARYLTAAGGAQNIRTAIYAYNHSQAYVEAVMLRAQLLGGTPPELLSAITGLTESRFPVHAAAHFTDGFPTVPESGSGSSAPKMLPGTTIYAPQGAPVIAVQDGQITAVGDSPTLGRYVSLRDAYGNTYTYAQLGSVAALYPVLEPRVNTAVSARADLRSVARSGVGLGSQVHTPRPSAPASAGVQPHSPLSQAAVDSGLVMGAASALETPPVPAPVTSPPVLPPAHAHAAKPRVFRAGPDEVYLHPLRPGVQVLAGTVLGHLGASTSGEGPPASTPAAAQSGLVETEPHMLFQIRPAGAGAPLIDPKPILDGWVRLEETSIFRAKGENPFLATSPTVGQVLLESKPQLEQLILRDPGVHLAKCERGAVQAGEVDRRVLATLEFLSVSGLRPTVSAASCGHGAGPAGARNTIGGATGETLDISAINGTPIAGHDGPGSVADIAVHRLLRLQGTMKPAQIVSAISYPGAANTLALPGYHGMIHVAFSSPLSASSSPSARAADALAARSPLTPSQWLQLIAQLGEIPEPVVASTPSAAAIPDTGSGGPAAGTSPSAASGVGGAGSSPSAAGGVGGSSTGTSAAGGVGGAGTSTAPVAGAVGSVPSQDTGGG
jgi:Transglycosylase SLT domain